METVKRDRLWLMVMLPPEDAVDYFFDVPDAVDVPVVVRSTGKLRRPSEGKWKSAVDPWTAAGQLPGDGFYLATTTWRQILQAATGVGRDLAPWLRKTPWLAVNEFIARVAPLQAYLCMKDVPGPEYAAGRRLFVSAVYQHGTERSAHSAFGYHLGMTMAQWACVGMSGLGSTRHIEAGGPNGNQGFLDASRRLPDLWGTHPSPRLPWLVEAKAGRHLGEGRLKDGKVQLNGGSDLMTVPHWQVLCGTSLPDRKRWEDDYLFMTIDTTPITPPPPDGGSALPPLGPPPDGAEDHIAEDVEALLAVARSQLMAYQAIAFGAVEDLRLIPVSKARLPGQVRAGMDRRPEPAAGGLRADRAAADRRRPRGGRRRPPRRTPAPARPRSPGARRVRPGRGRPPPVCPVGGHRALRPGPRPPHPRAVRPPGSARQHRPATTCQWFLIQRCVSRHSWSSEAVRSGCAPPGLLRARLRSVTALPAPANRPTSPGRLRALASELP